MNVVLVRSSCRKNKSLCIYKHVVQDQSKAKTETIMNMPMPGCCIVQVQLALTHKLPACFSSWKQAAIQYHTMRARLHMVLQPLRGVVYVHGEHPLSTEDFQVHITVPNGGEDNRPGRLNRLCSVRWSHPDLNSVRSKTLFAGYSISWGGVWSKDAYKVHRVAGV